MPDDALGIYASHGMHIKRLRMRGTWGVWVPRLKTIIVAEGLTTIQERCTVAHHLEHALAGHGPCGTGPHADTLRTIGLMGDQATYQDLLADLAAARKLLYGVDLHIIAMCRDKSAAALRLGVTEHLLSLRIAEEGEGPWPATSKTAG